MKLLVVLFFLFLGYLSYHLLSETSESADKELGRILTEKDAGELRETFERVVTKELKKPEPSPIEEAPPIQEDPALSKHEELFANFGREMEKDEIDGLNLARSYFFDPQLSSELKSELFDEILQSDISEENKKYLSREILKGPSQPSINLFEKALRNYTASLLPEEKREVVSDLKEVYPRQDIHQALERFALDQGL